MRKLKLALISGALAGTCLSSGYAYADYYKLYSPRVEKGELSAEADLNYSTDDNPDLDNYLSQVYGFEYGVTDWWQTELSAEIEKENADSNELTNYKWENVLAPWKPGENFIDTGLYVELEKGAHSGDPNNFETMLLLEKAIGKFETTANLKLEHEFGPNSEDSWGSGAAARIKYRYNQMLEPGIEYYADFGTFADHSSYSEQQHMVGPVLQGKIGKVKYDTGALIGVSDSAPDMTYKLNLEYEF